MSRYGAASPRTSRPWSPAQHSSQRDTRGTARAPDNRASAAGSCGTPAPARRGSLPHSAGRGVPSRGIPPPAGGGSARHREWRRPLRRTAPSLETEPFRHRDLHALDVMAVPHRLQEGVRETEEQEILHRLLAEIVVDAEDALLIEYLMQRRVERPRTREVVSEWLFHHDARGVCAPRGAEPLSDGLKHGGRNGEVMQGALRITQRGSERDIGVRAVVVALDVL